MCTSIKAARRLDQLAFLDVDIVTEDEDTDERMA
jgi:hypothetical protein